MGICHFVKKAITQLCAAFENPERLEVSEQHKVSGSPTTELPKASEQIEASPKTSVTEESKVAKKSKTSQELKPPQKRETTEQHKVSEQPKTSKQAEITKKPKTAEQTKGTEQSELSQQLEVGKQKTTKTVEATGQSPTTKPPKGTQQSKVIEQPEVTKQTTEQLKAPEKPKPVNHRRVVVPVIPLNFMSPRKPSETPKVTKQPEASGQPGTPELKASEQLKGPEQPEGTKQPVVSGQPKTTEPKTAKQSEVTQQSESPERHKITQQPEISSQRMTTKQPLLPKHAMGQHNTPENSKVFKQSSLDEQPKTPEPSKVMEQPTTAKANEPRKGTERPIKIEQSRATENIDQTTQYAAPSRPSKGKLEIIYEEQAWRQVHKPDTTPNAEMPQALEDLAADSDPDDPRGFVPQPPVGHERSFYNAARAKFDTKTTHDTPGAGNAAEPGKTETDRRPALPEAFDIAGPWNNILDNFHNLLTPQELQVLLAQTGHTLAPGSLRMVRPEDLALKYELEHFKHNPIDDLQNSAEGNLWPHITGPAAPPTDHQNPSLAWNQKLDAFRATLPTNRTFTRSDAIFNVNIHEIGRAPPDPASASNRTARNINLDSLGSGANDTEDGNATANINIKTSALSRYPAEAAKEANHWPGNANTPYPSFPNQKLRSNAAPHLNVPMDVTAGLVPSSRPGAAGSNGQAHPANYPNTRTHPYYPVHSAVPLRLESTTATTADTYKYADSYSSFSWGGPNNALPTQNTRSTSRSSVNARSQSQFQSLYTITASVNHSNTASAAPRRTALGEYYAQIYGDGYTDIHLTPSLSQNLVWMRDAHAVNPK